MNNYILFLFPLFTVVIFGGIFFNIWFQLEFYPQNCEHDMVMYFGREFEGCVPYSSISDPTKFIFNDGVYVKRANQA